MTTALLSKEKIWLIVEEPGMIHETRKQLISNIWKKRREDLNSNFPDINSNVLTIQPK